MNIPEKRELIDSFIKIIIVVVFSALYCLGGTDLGGEGFKWIRRFIAPAILIGASFAYTKDWRTLISLPLMFGSLSMGYGATDFWGKVLRRGLFGLANGISSSAHFLFDKRWLVTSIQTALCVLGITLLGVFNPMGSARAEEMTIGALIALVPTMSLRRKTK